MTEDTQTAPPVTPVTTPEASEETKRLKRILNAQKNYPATLEFTRNNTTLHATVQDCKRGNLKEAGCKYMGLAPTKEQMQRQREIQEKYRNI